ncbi:MAG: outer membrane protein assembly factor BamB [Planctomycetota bacterium]|jgi:outer membrane protein assembly factor BamB
MIRQRLLHALLGYLLCALAAAQDVGDWPTYRHDQARSGRTGVELESARLRLAWSWTAAQAPRPAWPGPARWDAYAKLEGLRSMREYDPVFHPVVASGRVLFGSSADDSVTCLDLDSGSEQWVFSSGGPVRVAPSVSDGRVFFGSDDGCAYALDLSSGQALWQRSAVPMARRVLHDGRLVSTWPVRSGVLVSGETATFGASFLPWKSSHLLAVDVATGEVVPAPLGSPPRWERDLGTGWTLEGPLLASADTLVAPQGRSAPLLFDRLDGAPQGTLPGGGGSFCLLTDDGQVLHGPGNKDGWISAAETEARVEVASYSRGHAVVVDGATAYLLAEGQLTAIDRSSGALLWTRPASAPLALIQAGEELVLGGVDRVEVRACADGALLWVGEVHGAAHGLVVAQGRLLVATDVGELSCFAAMGESLPAPAELVRVERPSLPSSPEVSDVPEDGLLDRFLFQQDQLDRVPLNVSDPDDPRRVLALANLGPGAALRLPGPPQLTAVGKAHALLLDGRTGDLEVAEDFRKRAHPRRSMTVNAQLRVDQVQTWGGVIGMAQDNGAYERGWMLGFREDRFGFALAGEDGGDGLTWLLAPQPFSVGAWHSIAGSYDGTHMRLYVDGQEVAQSLAESGAINYPEKAYYHLGAYRDADEHFRVKGALGEVALWERVLDGQELATLARQASELYPEALPPAEVVAKQAPRAELLEGPEMRFVSPTAAVVRFWLPEGAQPKLELSGFGAAQSSQRLEALGGGQWLAHLDGLGPDRLYEVRLQPQAGGPWTKAFELDSHFNLSLDAAPEAGMSAQALAIIHALPGGRGLVLGLDPSETDLWTELARVPGVRVVLMGDAQTRRSDEHQEWRASLRTEGIWGSQLAWLDMGLGARFDYPEGFAAAVVAPLGGAMPTGVSMELAEHWVRPEGGRLWLAHDSKFDAELCREAPDTSPERRALMRGALPGAGVWSHMYGLPDNSAYGGEDLGGARATQDLELSWIGRPGPRFQSDRQNRKPSPLAIGGRLHVQGLHRVLTFDAFSGTPLWGMELPELARFNLPRSSSNWCADEQRLYVALGSRLARFDGLTGLQDPSLRLPLATLGGGGYEWGLVVRHGELLYGSAVPTGAQFTEWWGGEHWYDAKEGEHASKVTSRLLFAMDPDTGDLRWRYQGGRVVDTTVVFSGERVTFLEARSAGAFKNRTGRLNDELWSDLWMVCLDTARGTELWRRPAKPMPGTVALQMATDGEFLALSSSGGLSHALYVFDAADGKSIWRKRFDWEADHHGKHLARPAMANGEVFLRPFSFDLRSGEVGAKTFPEGHQCGSYAATTHAVLLRAAELCIWDRDSRESTRWTRLRPDCWISTIPACGMLLSPEGGGGCSCGEWIEASMGFLPSSLTGIR